MTYFLCLIIRKLLSVLIFFHFRFSVPPKNLTIRDSKNNTLSGVIGPFEENAKVSLICEASGGKFHLIKFVFCRAI